MPQRAAGDFPGIGIEVVALLVNDVFFIAGKAGIAFTVYRVGNLPFLAAAEVQQEKIAVFAIEFLRPVFVVNAAFRQIAQRFRRQFLRLTAFDAHRIGTAQGV